MSKPSVEERAQALFRAAGRSEALPPSTLAAVWQRTEPKLSPKSAMLPKVLLLGVALAAAAWWLRPSAGGPVSHVEVSPPPAAGEERVEAPVAPPAPVHAERVETIVHKPPPPPVREAAKVVAQEEEDPLIAESRQVALAVTQLRVDRDAPAALATLDAHDQQFPHGALLQEARLARIEALIVSGQRSAALGLLESMNLSIAPRGDELRVLEGELLAESGRCPEALTQFSQAMRATLTKDAAERAERGAALCQP
jgi:hypothetical protein